MPPSYKNFWYRGGEKCEHHILTFHSDSTYRITAENKAGSCWTADDSAGKIGISGDTVIFYKDQITMNIDSTETTKTQLKEVFVVTKRGNLKRISDYQFMLAFYKMKEWKIDIYLE